MPAPGPGPSTRRLGRYHLSEWLGGGPTGEVHRAKIYGVAGMDRDFAVKRFHSSFVTGSVAAAEIAVAARLYGALDHPKVAKLREFGVSNDQIFTALEFVPGVDLAQLIDQGPLPLGAAASLVVQVGRAVGYAHGRGMCHLGLAPTNIICSARGQIKVTDFGFLPPRLPSRPADDLSLHARLCYLAPEQLEGLETSPATDVYQLGTIAYELMVGRKPYAGRTGVELVQQMLGGAVPESGLPKPFQKFLQRALARPPFERFPDTGAMADALEAALRASPTPGSLMDAGQAVTARQEFLADQRESQASGAVSFPVPAPPRAPREEVLHIATPPPTPAPPQASVARIKLAKMAASAVRTPPIPDLLTSQDSALDLVNDPIGPPEGTDICSAKATIPSMAIPSMAIPSMAVPVMEEGSGLAGDPGLVLGPAGAAATREQFIGGEVQNRPGPDEFSGASSPVPAACELEAAGGLDAAEMLEEANPELEDESALGIRKDTPPLSERAEPNTMVEATRPTRTGNEIDASSSPQPADVLVGSSTPAPPPHVAPSPQERPAKRGAPRALVYVALAMIVGAAAFLAVTILSSDDGDGPKAAQAAASNGADHDTPPDPAKGSATGMATPTVDAVPTERSSEPPAAGTTADAAVIEPPVAGTTADAAVVESGGDSRAPAIEPTTGPSDGLEIGSHPAGAKAYLDGTLVGTTPVRLDASPDSHRLALVLPGYALYTGQINGKGLFKIDLSEVTPPEGPGGIKVRCKKTNRYYVFIDGNPVGQLCPSERMGVSKGKHVVEIYDPITDARRAFNVNVVDTRLSLRVRVD